MSMTHLFCSTVRLHPFDVYCGDLLEQQVPCTDSLEPQPQVGVHNAFLQNVCCLQGTHVHKAKRKANVQWLLAALSCLS